MLNIIATGKIIHAASYFKKPDDPNTFVTFKIETHPDIPGMEKHIERFECNCDQYLKMQIDGDFEDLDLKKLIIGTNVKVAGEFYQMRKKLDDGRTISLNDIYMSSLEILPDESEDTYYAGMSIRGARR